ncbi:MULTISPECIES: bacteriophage abortive infection AbiH family protein [unclassified Shewanella]|uniref:bacteriophage abortive infection AbiH family protein n=1 Tax=Shewanella TaxID=22 RepID=UPI0021DAEC5D|nr:MULTISPECIES: bacteriophage abortive infection AbiH family protein [unclassified Shewanella]MCU7976522.1 bacteriophage abortive infection AbiH family protein [Shewanella sp. SW36]MCU7991762.1 bacteriophage abortive infection AbiH family protein [Shewanella sp. SW1]MCU8053142.1 bacteriophage abortive infection AbiH family protein [Shewanella sp. SM43]
MTTLVIVGNGFDIQNGLPTSYCSFFNQYNNQLDEHFVHFPSFYDDQEWSNFEENLGIFDEDNFRESAACEPSMDDMIESSQHVNGYNDEISQKVDELVGDIKSAFTAWIRGIDVNQAKKFMEFPKEYKFINFNYTSTLQDVYLVLDEDVLHIHGKARCNVIFGHGKGNGNQSSTMVTNDNTPWFEESYQTLASVTEKFHKPVNEILEVHKEQLEKYGDVTKIIVLGHSINKIDVPYFKCILNAYPNAVWRNWNHKGDVNDGVSDTHCRLLSLGVSTEKLYSLSSKKLEKAYPLS